MNVHGIDIGDHAVAPLLDAIGNAVQTLPPEHMLNAASALIGAGVGMAIGSGMEETEVREMVAGLIDTMMQVHRAGGQIVTGGSA